MLGEISLPAFIASCNKTSEIVSRLLPEKHAAPFSASLTETLLSWKAIDSRLTEPLLTAAGVQKNWDYPVADLTMKMLIKSAPSELIRGRLLAVSAPYAGFWLNAIPAPSLGLKLDNEILRISVVLRVGAVLCRPYDCVCGVAVADTATHGLDCRKTAGKHARHAKINNIVHRALNTAGIPSHLEPAGMCRNDGKRSDGATIIPWKQDKCCVTSRFTKLRSGGQEKNEMFVSRQ